jgi:hypothetical protein
LITSTKTRLDTILTDYYREPPLNEVTRVTGETLIYSDDELSRSHKQLIETLSNEEHVFNVFCDVNGYPVG